MLYLKACLPFKLERNIFLDVQKPMGKVVAAPDNFFFHRTMDISDWMKNKLTDLVESHGGNVIDMLVETALVTRMSKMCALNSVTLKFTDKNGEAKELQNYSNEDKNYEGSSGMGWLVTGIKELEAQAVLEFAASLRGYQSDTDYTPKVPSVEHGDVVTHDNLHFELRFAGKAAEMQRFLTEEPYARGWAGPAGTVGGGRVTFEDVVLTDLRAEKNTVKMGYAWKGWEEPSDVTITLTDAIGVVKVTVDHRNIPVKAISAVESHWRQRIFLLISKLFGLVMVL